MSVVRKLWFGSLIGALNACGSPASGVVATATPPATTARPDGGRCRDFELDAEHVWSQSIRDDVHAGILSVGSKVDQTVADRVVTKMNDITRNWVMMQENVCKDCLERKVLPEPTYGKISACLRTALVSQQTVATSLRAPTADEVFKVDSTLSKIADDLNACQREAVYSTYDAVDDPVAVRIRAALTRAQVLKDLGSLIEARDVAQKARELAEPLTNPRLFVDALVMQSRIAADMGDYAHAGDWARRAVFEAGSAEYELGKAGAFHVLVYVACNDKFYDDAKNYAQKGLAIRRRLLGNSNADTGMSLSDIGYVLYAQEDYQGALKYYQQAYDTFHDTLGEEQPRTVISMNQLGDTYEALNNHQQALSWYYKAMMICKSTLGVMHPVTADTAAGVGYIALELKVPPFAFLGFGAAAFIRNRVLGPKHPATIDVKTQIQTLCEDGLQAACSFSPSSQKEFEASVLEAMKTLDPRLLAALRTPTGGAPPAPSEAPATQ